jgi:DNA-binding response OmpR family regulator
MSTMQVDGPMNALVVEDRRDDAMSVVMMLSSRPEADFRVRSASTLAEARPILRDRADPVDVVILDLPLPDAQGVDLVKTVKEDSPHVGVIVVTGWPIDDMREDLKDAGAEAVLSKPVEPDELARRLQYSVLWHRTGAERFRAAVENTLSRFGDVIDDLERHITDSGRMKTIPPGEK